MRLESSTTQAPTPDGPRFGIVLRRAPGYRGMDVFFSGLIDGMDDVLVSQNAHLLLLIVPTLEEELAALARWHRESLVEAVLIADLTPNDPRVTLCLELGLPAVALGGSDSPEISAVDVDNGAAMTLAVRFLTGLGHRSIGRVSGPSRLRHTRVRDEAFKAELPQHGAVGTTLEGDYGTESGLARTRELLSSQERPTAIVYDNDVMAVAGLDVARELGLAVPADLSILAWDDSAVSRLASPPLSVVSRDVHELGGTTARALLERVAEGPVHLRHGPDAQVIERHSTARAPR